MDKLSKEQSYLEKKLLSEIYKNNEEGDEQMQPTIGELDQIIDQIVGITPHNNLQPTQQQQQGSVQQESTTQNDKTTQWIKEEEFEQFNNNLKKLGLCEKKGLDGIEMLYPIENKQKKLEKEELNNMIGRLYEKKEKKDSNFHMNKKAKRELYIEQNKIRETQERFQSTIIHHNNTNHSMMSNISATTGTGNKKKSKKHNDNFEQMILF